jgi:formylmethanofuran dehydrogenase subunit E
MTSGKFLFFPAWIATYICMSAPLGRVVDRHIKLYRYRSHPIVAQGEHLKEPLLHLVSAPKSSKGMQANSRRRRSEQRRNGPRKTSKTATKEEAEEADEADEADEVPTKVIGSAACPQCGGTMVERDGPNTHVCKICRHEWR